MNKYKFILASSILLMWVKSYAQVHPCASSKILNNSNHLSKSSTLTLDVLMNQYDVKFNHLNLNVERDTTYISGSVRTIAQVVADKLDTFGFELHSALSIDSIKYTSGGPATYYRNLHQSFVILSSSLVKNQLIDIVIYYHGTPPKAQNAAIGAGFSSANSGRWGNRATWSLSQPYSAYEWWPCKNSLQDKMDSAYVWITTSNENKAGSNGLLQRIVPVPGNKSRYEWRTLYPTECYLISVSVAKYVEYNTWAHLKGDSILIQNYIYDNVNTLPTFKPVLDQTASMIESFSEHFGTYPFKKEKYGHAMAPFSGGMEHQTMTTLGIIDFGIVAHELGHQWFGDHVTCKTWKDIWLNEGFASYIEYLALEWLDPGQEALHMMQVHNDVESQPSGSIALNDTTNVNRVFDSRLTYKKGSAFIHMIRFEINNDSIFFDFIRAYQQKYSYSTASTEEFKSLLEEKSGKDFTQFFAQWFYGQGYPIFNLTWNQSDSRLYIKSVQTTSSTTTTLFKTPITLKVLKSNGTDTSFRIMIDKNNDSLTIKVSGTVIDVIPDPNDWLLGKFTSSKDLLLGDNNLTFQNASIQIAPNPAGNLLQIISPIEISSYSIFDITGKVKLVGDQSNINLSELSPGMYFISVKNSHGDSVCYKFIKQ